MFFFEGDKEGEQCSQEGEQVLSKFHSFVQRVHEQSSTACRYSRQDAIICGCVYLFNSDAKTQSARLLFGVAGLFYLVKYTARRPPAVNTPTKASMTFAVSLLVGAFKAFVLMLMWNWFVTPVFHTEAISFWQVLGLLWEVQLFVGDTSENPKEDLLWENLFLVLDACVPEHKAQEVRDELKEKEEGI